MPILKFQKMLVNCACVLLEATIHIDKFTVGVRQNSAVRKLTSDIAKALLAGGLKSTSKDFTGMVKTVLSRDAPLYESRERVGTRRVVSGHEERTTPRDG